MILSIIFELSTLFMGSVWAWFLFLNARDYKIYIKLELLIIHFILLLLFTFWILNLILIITLILCIINIILSSFVIKYIKTEYEPFCLANYKIFKNLKNYDWILNILIFLSSIINYNILNPFKKNTWPYLYVLILHILSLSSLFLIFLIYFLDKIINII